VSYVDQLFYNMAPIRWVNNGLKYCMKTVDAEYEERIVRIEYESSLQVDSRLKTVDLLLGLAAT